MLNTCSKVEYLFRFEFNEGSRINALVLRSESFIKAIRQLQLILGDDITDSICSIHLIY